MAHYIQLKTHADPRGKLTVAEREIPFAIERVFYIYDVGSSDRGGHKNMGSKQVLLCLNGSCIITIKTKEGETTFPLNKPDEGLFVDTNEWHSMHTFSPGAILLVFASASYDPSDYVYEV
ncbi:hypothetical protein AUK40_03600 [Candidatus Wirthbacteria bacterium CG2_30_54_11]|uniref:Sugar 3,4-ketoisomerase QdtA cupin domain-containing protein n=1 Tax=Candidatus Wirthbacteria bacterium CG2_30_54_11 TaxID=1817892 RepID=A0A1J5IS67_9BACT|nr:MAG: hypothetical protein AUK40_03600 [Candidatus Wirthbacteria bacterium CG2_30_54_11]